MGGIHLYAAVVTALLQREHTGEGQLVEVAMQEAVYSSLAASYDYYHRTGKVPPRAGNRQAGLASAPYNTFPTTDGWVAIHVVTEGHWPNLLKAMGREDLSDDPRFRTNADRTAHMAETEAVVTAWTRTLPKMAGRRGDESATASPAPPVRNAVEVMNDPHMHERGMLERIDHPALGPIVTPNSPLRLHGADRVKPVPSPSLGQHNMEIYHGWLGLPEAEVAALQEHGVI